MQFAGRPSWQVRSDTSSLPLHAALYVREACGVPMTDDGPPPLLVTPPVSEERVTSADWHAWWRELLLAEELTWMLTESPWPLAPPTLAGTLDRLGDEPFRWVSRTVDDADRYRPPEYSLPVQNAVQRLEREFGRRSLMNVRIEGLAVQGDWIDVRSDGSVVLVSWGALDHAADWITDALRPAFRRA